MAKVPFPALLKVSSSTILEKLREVQRCYPPEILESTLVQTERDTFKIELIANRVPVGARVCDIGGGLGPPIIVCKLLGMDATLIDDFRDDINLSLGEAQWGAFRKYGVRVIEQDAFNGGLRLDESFDAITCFAAIEHQHNSPKRALHSMMDHLVPGGLFIVSGPNAVDIMKRIQTPLGTAQWSGMDEWYEAKEFRGHVRELRLPDFHYIARDLGLVDCEIIGRNWIWNRDGIKKTILKNLGVLLQRWPSVCTEIFMIGRKPH